jgi:hypothetical protein
MKNYLGQRRVTTNTPAKFSVRHPSAKGIDNILIEMKLSNKSDYTINFTRKALSTISRHSNLDKPDEVRMFIAVLKASDGYKRNLCIAYNKYAKFYNIAWNMPRYSSCVLILFHLFFVSMTLFFLGSRKGPELTEDRKEIRREGKTASTCSNP